ncbi:MAG: DUF5658 family protein [Candidatus Thermoplasmatota archaeon]|jgi:hypothetical protein
MTWWAPRPASPSAEAWQDFQAAVAWLLGLQLLDLLTTLGALTQGASEGNPFAAAILDSSGMAGLVRLKVVALLLMLGWLPAYAMVQRPGQARSMTAWAMLGLVLALVVLYSGVVVNNLRVLQLVVQP